MRFKILTMCLITIFITMTTLANDARGKRGLRKSSIVGDVVKMDVNRIELPMQNDGSFGEDGLGVYPKGSGNVFLFQGGIAATAFVDGQLRASWMAKASLIQEYQPGKWGMDPDDPLAKFYIVNKSDGFGSQAYQDWADAVSLGADFQDLDGDGQYDPNVDRPDMIGDRVIWCVFNDGTPINVRTPRLGTDPIGLEVQQQVWAFARSDELGDVIFVRYRFINTAGTDIQDLIFTIWEDPDLGNFQDDLIGSDTTRSLGYIYNDGDDSEYGPNPPAFGIDFFQGPVIFTGVNSDTAFKSRGPFFGVDTLVGWKNLPMTSFMFYINGDPVISDPTNAGIARNYQEGGLDRNGDPIDPTAWGIGGTPTTDNRFFYSGTPENGTGWLDITPADKRFMVNTGPFQLAVDDTQDVVVAYIVTQGPSDQLSSVAKLRVVDDVAQGAYNANFQIAGGAPPPRVDVRTFDERIELIIDLEANATLQHDESDPLGSRQVFEGIKIYQFGSNTTSENVGGRINKKLLTTFDLDNQFNGDIFAQNPETGEIIKVYDASLRQSIDPNSFVDEGAGILRYVIETDAFNNDQPLVNGVTYYFAVTAFTLNDGIIPSTGEPILYQDPNFGLNNWVSRKPAGITLLENDISLISVQPQSDELQPFRAESAEYVGSRANVEGRVFADLARRDEYTGHDYEVSFFDNGNFWRLTDLTTNTIPFFVNFAGDTVYVDSMRFQASAFSEDEAWTFPIVDGLSVQVYNVPDQLDTANIILADTADIAWIQGSSVFANSPTSIFSNGIDFVDNIQANIANGFKKEDYFPVKLVIDTTDIAMAHQYIANWNVFRGMKPVKLQAFDTTDPENPQQLNVAFLNPAGTIDFTANTRIIVLKSAYNEDGVYGPTGAPQDSAFKADAYIICNFDPVADSLLLANPLDITIKPFYPNSDLDAFQIRGEQLKPELNANEAKGLLDEVKVVPNPYFVTSTYETNFDEPIVRFTHLPSRRVTIRIFNLAGHLVNVLEKNDDQNELRWNLENSAGLKVASGLYIAHIRAEGVGDKVLKFMIIQREERIDRF